MLPLVYQMEVSDMEQWTVKEMAAMWGFQRIHYDIMKK